ncbi:MAG: diacylglycerol kinase family lipid kinase [Pyrinomonadaceae bacterium]|nr:diacylglycerol kinase family lipid kinase [Pyrinomonadaceae bacterium]MCX7638864.1 diacylglycerol kinase family lipid kinase [Pyrinomonadaceae bacterium]MDW8305000.1 diacylglycerol kinase family lipid kinase [Acidobacteriota bacterium]
MSDLPLVIVNPKSASGSTRSRWTEIASDLRAHFGAFRVAFTKSQGDAIKIAFEAAKRGKKFIIACGGDGTVNEVANGIISSGEDVELGVLPSGTGGDFRRSLKISTEIRQAARQLREGQTRRLDVGKISFINFNGKGDVRYFLNVASFGLSASVIRRVKTGIRFDWLPTEIRGRVSFALSTLQEIISANSVRLRICLDSDREGIINTLNFCICNARFFGGGMKIAPNAKLDDGLLDVVNIGDIGTLKILLNSYSLYAGTHLKLQEVKATLTKTIEAEPFDKKKIRIEADGELIGRLPAKFEVIHKALKVRVPYAEDIAS